MTASTARRWMMRRARSSAEMFCACADVTAQIKASAASIGLFMVLLLVDPWIVGAAGVRKRIALRGEVTTKAAEGLVDFRHLQIKPKSYLKCKAPFVSPVAAARPPWI